MTGKTYLSDLPASARILGDSERGEIEILLSAQPPAFDGATGIVFADDWITVVRDAVRFPNRTTGTYLRIFERPAMAMQTGVVVLPLFGDKIGLIEIYRHALRRWSLELPRGYSETDESAEATAKRELREELGLEGEETIILGNVSANGALLAGEVSCAAIHVSNSTATLDESESIRAVVWLTPAECMLAVADHRIVDGFTLSALLLAHAIRVIAL